MGAVIPNGKKKNKEEKRNQEYDDQKYIKDQGYEEDTIDSANLALAINKGDFTSNVLIRFSCENLPKMDTLSQSDPIIAVYQTIDDKKDFVGLTECIPDNCNPKFVKSFIFSYNVSNIQNPITCEIFDVNNFNAVNNIKLHKYIGTCTFNLIDVMLTASQTITRDVFDTRKKKKKCGTLTIRGQEYDVSGKKVLFELGGRDIASKHELYLVVSSMRDGKDYPVYATQPEKKSKKQIINWKKFQIPMSYFGENSKSYVKIEVYEFYKEKGHILIGDIETNIQYLIDNSGKAVSFLMNQLKVGELKLHTVKLDHRVSFLNYLLADAEVSLIVAVDFTNSNKEQTDPTSLHYKNTEKNTYYQALNNLVGILQYFDADNRIPLYGFGAKLPPYYNIVSHGFALNENIFDPYINGGSDNLIRVYKQKAPTLKMHGPTVFSEVISLGKTWAQKENEPKNYYVLLIVTDGINNDIENTLDEIVDASQYPLTIIIVGIGDEDFTQLKELLEPQKPNKYLYSKRLGKQAIRNNVHFFVYNDYKQNMQTLARECMRKLPKQFIQYMEMKGTKVPPQDKNMKEATETYMHKKMDQKKNAFKKKKKYQIKQNLQDDWILKLKENFYKKLIYLKYEPYYIDKIIKEGIAVNDVNLFIEKLSYIKMQEIEEKKQKKQEIPTSKIKINKRLDIPNSTLEIAGIKKDPKIGQRIFKIKSINQTDLIMEQQKKESMKNQQQFIKAIQNKQTDDQKEFFVKQQKQLFLEKKYHQYLSKIQMKRKLKKNQSIQNEKYSQMAQSQFNINYKMSEKNDIVDLYIQKGDNLFFKGDYDITDDESDGDNSNSNSINNNIQNQSIQNNINSAISKKLYFMSQKQNSSNSLMGTNSGNAIIQSLSKFQSQNNSPSKTGFIGHKKNQSMGFGQQISDLLNQNAQQHDKRHIIPQSQQFRKYQLGTGRLIQQTKEKIKRKKEKEENSIFYFNSSDSDDNKVTLPHNNKRDKVGESLNEKIISQQYNKNYTNRDSPSKSQNQDKFNFIIKNSQQNKQSQFSRFKNKKQNANNIQWSDGYQTPMNKKDSPQNFQQNLNSNEQIKNEKKKSRENSLINDSDYSSENAEYKKIEKIVNYKDFVQIIESDENYFDDLLKNDENYLYNEDYNNFKSSRRKKLNKQQEGLLRKKMQQFSEKKEDEEDNQLQLKQQVKQTNNTNFYDNKLLSAKLQDISVNNLSQNISQDMSHINEQSESILQPNNNSVQISLQKLQQMKTYNQQNTVINRSNSQIKSEQQWILQQQEEELKKQQDRLKEEKSKKIIYQNDMQVYKYKQNRCLICQQNEASVVLQPCGDIGFCRSCFDNNLNEECCICGAQFNRKKCYVVVDDDEYYNDIFG